MNIRHLKYKTAVSTILIWIALASPCQADRRIKELVLDWRQSITLRVGYLKNPLTVMFPSKINGGLFFENCIMKSQIKKVEDIKEGFIIDFSKDSYFFTVWAAKSGARGSINVVYDMRSYTIDLVETDKEYYSSVTLVPRNTSGGNGQRYKVTDPTVLNELVRQSKMRKFLKEKDIPLRDEEYYSPGKKMVTEYENFELEIKEVFRYDKHDTLVFKCVFTNKSDKAVLYDPYLIAPMCETTRFPVSLILSSGVIPPLSSSPVWFACTNTRAYTGGKPVSPKNDWIILIVTDPMKERLKMGTTTVSEYLDSKTNDIYKKAAETDDLEKLKESLREMESVEKKIKLIKGEEVE